MTIFQDYDERENKDACEICEQQRVYFSALGLTNACMWIGK